MDVSVIMAACNQGDYCRQTVESIHNNGFRDGTSYEVVVVDDCSDDGCCDNLRDATVIRTHWQMGCSASRRTAAEATSGDVILITDPHCSFTQNSLDDLALCAKGRYGIFQPSVYEERRHHYLAGGRLQLSERGIRITRPKRPHKLPALFGSIYALRHDVYERLGSLPQLPGTWGRWEQCMTLLAYRCDIPIHVQMDIHCTHHNYRRKGTYPFIMNPTEEGKNSFYVHATLLPESYEKVWKHILTDYHVRHGGDLQNMLRPLHAEPCKAFAAFVKSSSILSEEEFYLKLFNRTDPQNAGRVAKALASCLKV